jgi:hypothetical protein
MMRQMIGGSGQDTTAAAAAYLAANNKFKEADLYLIGEPDDPMALWLTNWEAPLLWPVWGLFRPAVITRGTITTKVGLDVNPLDVTWSPANRPFTSSVATANPLQLANLGFYDNWRVRVWRTIMPTPGDANTFGAYELFGGRIATTEVSRGKIQWTVNSYMDVLDQKLPANVIEWTNTFASYTAATIPAGDPSIPLFQVVTGSTPNSIIADCVSPTAGKIYSGNLFTGGYMVFLDGTGATLAGAWSAIGGNGKYTDGDGNDHSIFSIYAALPWAPTPGADQFYVSMAAPVDVSEGGNYGFPYVPDPSTGV